MKKIFRIGATVVLTFLVTVVGATVLVSAKDDNVSMRSVIERLDKLTEVLVNALDKNTDTPEGETAGGIATADSMSLTMINPRCLDGYPSWPKSNFLKENADWNIAFLPINQYTSIAEDGLFMDINSDGLTDYVFHRYTNIRGIVTSYRPDYDGATNYVEYESCILLNNGHGWDIGHKCVVKDDGGRPVFYGDCADLSA